MWIVRRFPYWVIVSALALAFCAASIFMLVELRRDALSSANSTAQNILTILANDVENTLSTSDNFLKAIATSLHESELSDIPAFSEQSLLFDSQLLGAAFAGLLIVNQFGDVIQKVDWKGSDVSPAQIATILSDKSFLDASQSFIIGPFKDQNNTSYLLMSRQLLGESGSVNGFVVAKLDLNYFRTVFEQASLRPGDSINLFSKDGVLLMRNPYLDDQIGRDLSQSPAIRKFQDEKIGMFSAKAAVDGVNRIYNFKNVAKFPFMINVALSEDQVFKTWRFQAIIVLAVLALLCLLSLALAFNVRRAFTRQLLAETALKKSEMEYRLLADNATDVIVRLDNNFIRKFVSPSSQDVLGISPQELMNKCAQNIIHPDDWPLVQLTAHRARLSQVGVEAVYRLRHISGRFIWVEGRYKFVNESEGFIVALRDISKRKAAEDKLEEAYAAMELRANTDALTGLYNRRFFTEALDRQLKLAKDEFKPLSILLIDVDHFKQFNDNYGHQAGDECLTLIAHAISHAVTQDAVCARYGGEEFIVMLPGKNTYESHLAGDQVRTAVRNLIIPHSENETGIATISVGCSTFSPDLDLTNGDLIKRADIYLYEAKQRGRDCVISSINVSDIGLIQNDASEPTV